MASPSTVITLGYGSFGSVNLLPTIGYGIASTVAPTAVYDNWVSPRRRDWVAPLRSDWTASDRDDWVAPQRGDE